ncbi:MAG: DEAD/DEAH box helicase family protein [Bacteroides sp.]|nr:DEAD/DEAH box helicase family protein [Bacteroides sp.]
MTFRDILQLFRDTSYTQKDKGSRFERIIRDWFKTDPRYSELTEVWLWEDFPSRKDFGGKDTGIDIVAKTDMGKYWAIQCKCYAEDVTIDKPAVDSFLATSSRTFTDPETFQTVKFSNRVWVATTVKWGQNANDAIQNQNPPVSRISLFDLETSSVDWEKLYNKQVGKNARQEGKALMRHQLEALSAANRYYEEEHHDRGKLIMACGTGKTFTSLRMAEALQHEKGLVLFLVPSISLLGQSLNAWASDSKKPIKAICICSDARVSRKIKNEQDDSEDTIVDLAIPASTNTDSIRKQLLAYRNHDGLTVVFSTYQSIDAVQEAQKAILADTDGAYGTFDFIVCDEAHRTTGVKISNTDESNFTKIHNNDYIRGYRRLYMTATPRLYGESAKIKASQKDCVLCSMDDESVYGKEFYRINFSEAVQQGLLTDYKVLVLTVNESEIPENIRQDIKDGKRKELKYDDTTKLIGVINGLSKNIRGDNGVTWEADPCLMHRAVAFCSAIGDVSRPGTSKNVADILPRIAQKYIDTLTPQEKERVVNVVAEHIDGSMNASERAEKLAWLKQDSDHPNECRVLTNVRCLSEGIDVPALDAVLFLSARNSQVDVVQSVGRVMRNFRKNQPGEKRYGYIIIPIVVPQGVKPEDALNDNNIFGVVWSILNALRSHDDHFNAEVNKIALNKARSAKVIVGGPGIGKFALGDQQTGSEAKQIEDAEVARQLEMRFGQMQDGIYAKLVEKCGDRLYWENWAKEIGDIARKFMERITRIVKTTGNADIKREFTEFVKSLQTNLNPSVDEVQAIEMLAQHMITRPVFDALFADYQFVHNNAVSRSMQTMIDLLEKDTAAEKDTEVLARFYESVRSNVGNIDNLEGKQTIIKNLYEKFFKGAFPLTVEKLGIVYTPVECVDFIIRSVDDILKEEFRTSLTEENVHILDPFTGTGTFITRLLQSGLIKDEDFERKYIKEIHCNEIVLLAYYIADVNIESVFHDITKRKQYLSYDGICLTDTFQLTENTGNPKLFSDFFKDNNERAEKQKKAPIRVIVGNPPYSVGQKSANDNAQNLSYPTLDGRIASTYVEKSSANLSKGLYDSYIKAFRWASDRIAQFKDGGIVAFISNGAWIDGNAQDGMRQCLEEEFSSIYVLNLRGNARTSGEQRCKEGGGVFDVGSRTPITITFLVKNPAHKGKAVIHYHDIGDYLTREQKLKMVKEFKSISSKKLDWQIIEPNDKHDWINQRDGAFDSLIPVFPEKKFTPSSQSFFSTYAIGISSNRDAWVNGFSRCCISNNINSLISFYDKERNNFLSDKSYTFSNDARKISWTVNLKKLAAANEKITFDSTKFIVSVYRPFTKSFLYYTKELIERPGIWKQLFPTNTSHNFIICVNGVGSSKLFTPLITDLPPALDMVEKGQCFPLYYYEEKGTLQGNLFDDLTQEDKYIRHDAITDWILKEVRNRFGGAKTISTEDIFYYVYGILHSPDYRERFADDLRKSLPRLPIVEKAADFVAFSKAGRQLAELHLNYDKDLEDFERHPGVELCFAGKEPVVQDYASVQLAAEGVPYKQVSQEEYDFYAIADKMRFAKVRNEEGKLVEDKTTIVFNLHITLRNIPSKAYEYVVNGKSAVEWVMERYAITIDKDSGIKNDPNDLAREHCQPRYILNLLLSVIDLSQKSVDLIAGLPKLNFD